MGAFMGVASTSGNMLRRCPTRHNDEQSDSRRYSGRRTLTEMGCMVSGKRNPADNNARGLAKAV